MMGGGIEGNRGVLELCVGVIFFRTPRTRTRDIAAAADDATTGNRAKRCHRAHAMFSFFVRLGKC